jgi:PAS domain S-box-containing protein
MASTSVPDDGLGRLTPRKSRDDSGRPAMAPRRRFDPKLLAVGFGLFFVWTEATRVWQHWGLAGQVFSYTAFIPLQLAVAVAFWRAARRSDLPAATRRGLRLFALNSTALAFGSVTLALLTIGAADEPSVSVADLFYTVSYPLITAGLLVLPRREEKAVPLSRQLLDAAALILTAGILVAIHLSLRKSTGLAQVLATAYPVLALVGLLATNTALTHGLPIPSRRAWMGLMVAQAITLIGDIMFQTLWATGYSGPNWSVAVGVAVNLAMLWVGDWFRRDPMPEEDAPPRPLLPFSPLPIILAIGGAGVLLMIAVQGSFAIVQPILVTLIGLNLVLVAREFFLLTDATRAARAEAERKGAVRFEALVRHSTDLILVVDEELVVRFASPPIRHLLARSPEQMVGTPLVSLVHPDDGPAALQALGELLGTPDATRTSAARLLHADGDWRRFEWKAANLMAEPAVAGLVLNCRDVTERTRLEEQLRQAQKMEVVGHLAGGVAHDFNNLLTAVLAETDFALDELPVGAPLRAELENIRSAAQRGRAITSRLLSFSRPSGAEPRVVPIGQRVLLCRPLIQRMLGEGYRLEISVDQSQGSARIDPDELEHALLNLVANARDAMGISGTLQITVTDREETGPIESPVLPGPPGRYVRCEVADSGHGMDRATLDRLFQPFFTTKRVGQGTGLGLTAVLAFARRSNAALTVRSQVGAGASFQLWFPEATTTAERAPRPSVRAVTPGAGTILLVEDDDVVRHATRRILTAGGYRVLEAQEAEEARRISAARGHEVDMVVTDVMMPGETGAALAEGLRAERPDLPVLFISGYPGEDLARLGLRFRDVELLRKPFTARELTERVREVMAAR